MKIGFKVYFENECVFTPIDGLLAERSGDKTVYRSRLGDVDAVWTFAPLDEGYRISLSLSSDKPLKISRVDSLCIRDVDFNETDRVLFFGNKLYTSEHRYPCEISETNERAADCTGLFSDLSDRGMAIAMISPFSCAVGAGAIKKDERLEFFAKTEFTEAMRDEKSLEANDVLFLEDASIDRLYDIYRSLIPKSGFDMPKLIGWNTWDYYLNRVTPEDIFENIEAMKNMPFADKLKYIVIDDGWQKEWGEWRENEKFACGLDTVAKRIEECGFTAGIWMAPLLVKSSCGVFEELQECFCKKEDGNHLRSEGGTYVLDPTHPRAEAFILDNYRYLYAMGYRLFKIDYLSPITAVKSFYDKGATPYSALAELIVKIREATGEDAVILGCSLPVQCGADIAPSMRIGVDIHNHFSHVVWIAEMLSWTWMYNCRNTRIDPDFLIVRGLETADEPLIWEGTPNYTAPKRRQDMTDAEFFKTRWRQGDQFNAIEAETWAYLVAMSGGNIFLSDKMSVLNEKGIELIADAFAAESEEIRPVYLKDDKRLPTLWLSDGKMLLVNWENEPRSISVNVDADNLTSKKKFSLENGILSVTLKPHESFFAVLD